MRGKRASRGSGRVTVLALAAALVLADGVDYLAHSRRIFVVARTRDSSAAY